MIERRINIGLIVSTPYIKKIRPVWDSLLLESSTARMIANWCITFYDKYQKAPGKEIENIFFEQVKGNLDKDIAEEIEEDILPELSEEFLTKGLDVEYLLKESLSYLKSRQLLLYSQQIENIIENGQGDLEDRLKQATEL